MLFEDTWATGFLEALRDAGGHMVKQGFLTREALMMVGAELEAVAEGAALLDALDTVFKAEQIKEVAVEEAAEVVEAAAAIKAMAATEAVRALIAAEFIEAAAVETASKSLEKKTVVHLQCYSISAARQLPCHAMLKKLYMEVQNE